MKIDLVPLQDVLFVACIFMVMALSYNQEHIIDFDVPDYESTLWCCDGCESIVVTVDRGNNIWINKRLVEKEDLPKLLKGAKYNGAVALGVNIRAELRSNLSTYSYIVESSKRAGIKNIQLLPYDDIQNKNVVAH